MNFDAIKVRSQKLMIFSYRKDVFLLLLLFASYRHSVFITAGCPMPKIFESGTLNLGFPHKKFPQLLSLQKSTHVSLPVI